MRIIRWLWIGSLLILLVLETIACSGSRQQIKAEPDPDTLSTQKAEAPQEATPSAPPPTPTPGSPVLEPPKEMPKRERLPEPRMPSLRSTGIPPASSLPSSPSAPPPTRPPGAMPMSAPPVNDGARFVLNFDNADLYEVIRVMADMMKINFIIDQRVRGVVNIRSAGRLSQEDIFPIFQSILKLNGATAVKKGIIYEIVPFGEAKKIPQSLVSGKEAGKQLGEERYTIQIIPLQYIPAAEVSKILKPFISDGADLVEHPQRNILILGDMTSNIKKSLEMIELFDVDFFAEMRVRIYPVLNADVNEIAKEMERIFTSFEVSLKSGMGVGITFTPIVRVNSLLVVSSIPHIFDKVERWIKELDRVPSEGTKLSVFVYYVQNGKAKDLAEILKQVYQTRGDKKAEFKEKVVTQPAQAPGPRGVRPATPTTPTPGTPSAAPQAGVEAGVPEGEINIVVDETTNALIIRAYQRDYNAIVDTVKKLDLYPKQVLIEVLLGEITLTDLTKYGLEFSTFTDTFVKGGRAYSYTAGMGGVAIDPTKFASGLRYAISSADRLAAAIHFAASENLLNVISSPHILASNNKEAKIQIGASQPILTNTYTTGSTSTTGTGVVEGSIEYKDIGIILTVTPRISDGKLVTLDISIEDSSVSTTTLGNLPEIPVFKKKTVKTTLSIMEGQTIVLGGLIEESKEKGSAGVPFLSKIPILGALFGYQTRSIGKTETILMLTPHVISDQDESRVVSQEFQDKVESIKKEIERKKIFQKKGK